MATIPNANQYAVSTGPSIEMLNKRFDDRQIEKMSALTDIKFCKFQWEQIRDILVNAKSHNNLRNHVRGMFLGRCPYADVADSLRPNSDGVGKNVVSFSDARAGKPAAEKARKAARAERDREDRAKMKTASNGGGGKQQQGKGNKKSKK
jgi:hypothetical protein